MKIYPNKEFAKNAYFNNFEQYKELYEYSEKNYEDFWEKQARENLTFFEDFTEVLDETNFPYISWFKNAKLNISYEILEKNISKNPDKIAIIFEGERGDSQKVTYKQLYKNVCKSANLLKKIGVRKGSKIIFYMPQILESIYLMIACLRIGAIHSVVFGGFSAESLKDRIEDLKADFLITADGAFRKGRPYLLKTISDEAISKSSHKVKKTLVVRRNFEDIFIGQNDIVYNDEIDLQDEKCDFEKIDSEDISFVLYTSGSTGKPKGIIHSTAGYALGVKLTTKWVFDLQDEDIFFSTADIGWITGHSYTVYGPLLNGGTTLIYVFQVLYFQNSSFLFYKYSKHLTNALLI